MKKGYICIAGAVFLLMLFSSVSFAAKYSSGLYKWVDKDGQLHITDYPNPTPPTEKDTAKKPADSGKGLDNAVTKDKKSPSPPAGPAAPSPLRSQVKPSLLLEKTIFSANEKFKVAFSAASTYKKDAWVGIIPSNIKHGKEALNDQHDLTHQSLRGKTSGALEFVAPKAAGKYDLRMHDTDKNGVEVASVSFSVKGGQAPLGVAVTGNKKAPAGVRPKARAPTVIRTKPKTKSTKSRPGLIPPIAPDDMMKVVLAFVLPFMFIIVAVFALIYVYFSYTQFRIAQKLDVPAAWLAWIPYAQAFWPFVGSAGKPWWWIFLLMFVPIINLFLYFYLWMRISENLGKSKWLPLLFLVPVIGLAVPGYLAFSKFEGDTGGGSFGDAPIPLPEDSMGMQGFVDDGLPPDDF